MHVCKIAANIYKGTDDIALTSLHSHIAHMDRRHCIATLPTWTDVIADMDSYIADIDRRHCTATDDMDRHHCTATLPTMHS